MLKSAQECSKRVSVTDGRRNEPEFVLKPLWGLKIELYKSHFLQHWSNSVQSAIFKRYGTKLCYFMFWLEQQRSKCYIQAMWDRILLFNVLVGATMIKQFFLTKNRALCSGWSNYD